MPVTTELDKFRLLLGDTPAAYGLEPDDLTFQGVALLNDAEAQFFIDGQPGSILLAVADACDALAARFAQDVDTTEDGQSFKDSQKAERYAAMAARFRTRAVTETAASLDGAGLPMGRVPYRTATTWATTF